MARKRVLNLEIGQRLLQSKLDVLNGTGGRRPSLALSILTGGVPEPRPARPTEPLAFPRQMAASEEPEPRHVHRVYAPRTVYLTDRHLRDLDAIVDAWQANAPRRLTRSAVLRQAIEHLRAEVQAADAAAESTLE
jgi:hypothetical protein